MLALTLGGTSYAWGSPFIIFLGVAAVVLLVVFIIVERRAAEPVLPPRLFANRVFAATSAIGLIVGFALFGSVTYLPLFLQVVNGASPTGSGLQILPLMGGLLVTSIVSGQIISRTGHYKPFPIVGTALMVVGLLLLSGMTATTTQARGVRLHVRARPGDRLGHAGARARGPERRRLRRPRRGDVRRDACFARSAARSGSRCSARSSPAV